MFKQFLSSMKRSRVIIFSSLLILFGAGVILFYYWHFMPCSFGRTECQPPIETFYYTAVWQEDGDIEGNIVYPYKDFSEDTINWPGSRITQALKRDYPSFSPINLSNDKLMKNFGGNLSKEEVANLKEMLAVAKSKQGENVVNPQNTISSFSNLPFSREMGIFMTELYDMGRAGVVFKAGNDFRLVRDQQGKIKYIVSDYKFTYPDNDEEPGYTEQGKAVAEYDQYGRMIRMLNFDDRALPLDSIVLGYYIWSYDSFGPVKIMAYTAALQSTQLAVPRISYETKRYFNTFKHNP